MDIETYLETSAQAGDQRGPDDHLAVTDLLNCLSNAAVDATASYTDRLNIKLGDVLWYVAAIARRRKLTLRAVAKQHLGNHDPSGFDDYMEHAQPNEQRERTDTSLPLLLNGLLRDAANTTSGFLEKPENDEQLLRNLGGVLWHIAAVARHQKLGFSDIARDNLRRIETLFGASSSAPDFFDSDLDADEQLPRRISLRFSESIRNGLATVRMAIQTKEEIWLPIGSPLNDNSHIDDYYRFHDVLHLAYVAILGWSPVMRALFGLKRKSLSTKDRVEDGARAILLEEALTGIVYESASDNALFRDHQKLERRLLLTVKRLTRTLEVRVRTYDQWTFAILSGYSVFREITESAKERPRADVQALHIGLVHVNMNEKKVWFEPC
jgi:hypothetical protein